MKFSWHWFRLSRAAWRSVTLFIVLLVVYVVAGRQLMPLFERSAPNIAIYLSKQLEQPVAFESLQGYWYGLRPTLVFEGVGIANELEVRRVVLEPAILASLIQRRPIFSRLELDGFRLELAQVDGIWTIPALAAFSNRPWFESLALFSGEEVGVDAINLRDITVSLKGQTQTLDVHIRDGLWLSDRTHQQLRGFAFIKDSDQNAEANLQLDIVTQHGLQNIYLSLNHSRFNYLGIPGELRSKIPWQPEIMSLAAKTRWHWQQGQIQAVQLDVSEGEVAWLSDQDNSMRLNDVSFNLAWHRQDALLFQMRQLSFRQNKTTWPATNFDFTWAQDGVSIKADSVALEPLHQASLAFPSALFLADLAPTGVVADFALNLPRLDQQWLWSEAVATGTLREVQIARFGWLPGLSGLNGHFRFSGREGMVRFKPSQIAVDLPGLIPEPFQMGLSEGVVGWSVSSSGKLHVTSSELDFSWRDSGRVQGRFNFAGNFGDASNELVEPVFALSLTGNQLHKQSFESALPMIVPKSIRQWLVGQIDILEADAWSLSLPNLLASDVKPRLGLMMAHLERAQLDVSPQWPKYFVEGARVDLNYRGLTVAIADSNYGELAIARAEVQLPFSNRPEVRISGLATGRAEDAFNLVRNTPIRSRVHAELLKSEVEGSVAGTLDIRIPLNGEDFEIELGLAVRNVDFYWPTYDVRVHEITGPLSISLTNGVHSSGLVGRFLEGPIQMTFASQPLAQGGWRLELPAQGTVHSDSFLSWLDFPKFEELVGQSMPYRTRFVITPNMTSLEVDLEVGDFAFNLPLKTAQGANELSLKIDFEPQTRSLLLRWPGVVVADLRTFTDWYPMDGHIAIGNAQARSRSTQGVTIDMHVDEFSASRWQDAWVRFAGQQSAVNAESQAWRSVLNSLAHWNVRKIVLSAQTFSDWPFLVDGIDLELLRDEGAWQSDFSATRAQGSVWIPDARNQMGRLSLQHLILGHPKPEAAEQSAPEAPEDRIYPNYDPDLDGLSGVQADWFPDLVMDVQDVVLNGQSIGPWAMKFRAEPDQIVIQDILGTWREVDVTGELIWQTPVLGWHQTQANFSLSAANMANVLKAANLSPVVTSRHATGRLSLTWPGTPLASNRYRWQGEVQFNLVNGSVLEFEDLDAVRLIGLMNVTRIFRRLAFDFQDVFGAGIAFDRVRGHLLFNDGWVSVGDRLTLQGSGARMFFEGDYQMLRDQLDAEGVLVARVSNTAGLLAIGAGFAPPLALAIILGERVLEREIERLFSVRTSISGSLRSPVVQSRRLFDSDIRGADTTFQERLRELFGPDQSTNDSTF